MLTQWGHCSVSAKPKRLRKAVPIQVLERTCHTILLTFSRLSGLCAFARRRSVCYNTPQSDDELELLEERERRRSAPAARASSGELS